LRTLLRTVGGKFIMATIQKVKRRGGLLLH